MKVVVCVTKLILVKELTRGSIVCSFAAASGLSDLRLHFVDVLLSMFSMHSLSDVYTTRLFFICLYIFLYLQKTRSSACMKLHVFIYGKGAGEDDSKVLTECITDSKFQACYLYCVGMHQKRAGNTTIVLYIELSILNGLQMVNMQCFNYNAAVGDTGATQTAYVEYSSTD